MAFFHKDPTNGIFVHVDVLKDLNQAKVTALDDELDNETNNRWISQKAQDTANLIQANNDIAAAQLAEDAAAEDEATQRKNEAEGLIAQADANIARNNLWRTHLGELTGYINELTAHRAR